MTRMIATEIEIAAPAHRVWSVLTDFAASIVNPQSCLLLKMKSLIGQLYFPVAMINPVIHFRLQLISNFCRLLKRLNLFRIRCLSGNNKWCN